MLKRPFSATYVSPKKVKHVNRLECSTIVVCTGRALMKSGNVAGSDTCAGMEMSRRKDS